MSFYRKDQLLKVAKLIKPEIPKWLLLGGPADGNEAQCAVACWPGVRVLAVEPNAGACNFQRANGFPGPEGHHWLWDGALMDWTGKCDMSGGGGDLRHARITPDQHEGETACWQLDFFDALCGPFDKALLWLDVEGSEARALKGAEQTLAAGRIHWVTLETSEREPEVRDEAEGILRRYGFDVVKVWNVSGPYKDTLWRLA